MLDGGGGPQVGEPLAQFRSLLHASVFATHNIMILYDLCVSVTRIWFFSSLILSLHFHHTNLTCRLDALHSMKPRFWLRAQGRHPICSATTHSLSGPNRTRYSREVSHYSYFKTPRQTSGHAHCRLPIPSRTPWLRFTHPNLSLKNTPFSIPTHLDTSRPSFFPNTFPI